MQWRVRWYCDGIDSDANDCSMSFDPMDDENDGSRALRVRILDSIGHPTADASQRAAPATDEDCQPSVAGIGDGRSTTTWKRPSRSACAAAGDARTSCMIALSSTPHARRLRLPEDSRYSVSGMSQPSHCDAASTLRQRSSCAAAPGASVGGRCGNSADDHSTSRDRGTLAEMCAE